MKESAESFSTICIPDNYVQTWKSRLYPCAAGALSYPQFSLSIRTPNLHDRYSVHASDLEETAPYAPDSSLRHVKRSRSSHGMTQCHPPSLRSAPGGRSRADFHTDCIDSQSHLCRNLIAVRVDRTNMGNVS